MDKETLSNYGWIVIAVLVLVVMIALATPFGTFVSEAVQSTTKGLFDVNKTALDAAGVPGLTVNDQEFDVPDMNHGATQTPTIINFTIDGIEYQAEEGMIWGDWVTTDYNTCGASISAWSHQDVLVNGKTVCYLGANTSTPIAQATERIGANSVYFTNTAEPT